MTWFRWILTPFAFPVGLLLGHWIGKLSVIMPMGFVGYLFLWFTSGAMSSALSIMLPALVAPSAKEIVGKIAFWCQIIIWLASIAITIYMSAITKGEVLEYIVSMIGCLAGAIFGRSQIENFSED